VAQDTTDLADMITVQIVGSDVWSKPAKSSVLYQTCSVGNKWKPSRPRPCSQATNKKWHFTSGRSYFIWLL